LQRLLGLSDVCVRSAGGSEPEHGKAGHGAGNSLHMGTFENVINGVEIRDLIIERLRRFREAGLGDPDDKHLAVPPADHATSVRDAARELVAEARALRQSLA
jgi:hypothetical protein